MVLGEKEIHVWRINFNAQLKAQRFFHDLLNPDEKDRVSKFRFAKDKRKFNISRGVLRILVGEYLEMDPQKVTFRYEKYGKPQLQHETRMKFNVSHSGDMAIIGFVKDYDIGVDIEHVKNDFNVLDLAENFFSRHEIEMLRTIPPKEQPLAFYRCWTRKEAFIKAEGSGLSFPLHEFTVSMTKDNEAKLEHTDWNPDAKHQWSMFSFKPAQNYIAALAINDSATSFKVFDWK